ncbi:energy transducer TonB [Mucilaginibacter lappiensis]|uniref:TonB family protein n=1 Tax=Mucilaginibacter lappiensis TaxID=354630 RepID=A0A841JD71_9SPHI|nr:energy transducer TonB [Mucilaginibacter lappiensis]MBB6129083.1 TonB family protein [Mucilaginibacter lappiensis]
MKPYYFLLAALLIVQASYAHTGLNADTTVKPPVVKQQKGNDVYTSVEVIPEYPGGIQAFGKYITNNLKYPYVARLLGINGRVVVSFVVDQDGKLINVTPLNCIGAGCEAEAVKVVQESKPWKPGIQDGKPVRVQFSVPISFYMDNFKIPLKQLEATDYGFVFDIKGTLYTITEAEYLIGSYFMSDQVQIVEPYYNSDNNEKFKMPEKRGVYLVKMKSR